MKKNNDKRARLCRNDGSHATPTFGVYCHKCLAALKREKKQRAINESFWLALEFRAGDLWRNEY